MRFISKIVKNVAAVGCMLTFVAGAAWAQPYVYYRFSDGRVIQGNTTHWNQYRNQGAIRSNSLPNGYVSDPYNYNNQTYNNGAPVYYNQQYWQNHKRHWKGEKHNKGGQHDNRNHDRN